MHELLEYVSSTTLNFEKTLTKEVRKKKSQYFTPMEIARFMADIFDCGSKKVTVLDPSGGTGVLSMAILVKLLEEKIVDNVILDIYEIDPSLLNILNENIKQIKLIYLQANINLKVTVHNENFITCINKKNDEHMLYDLIICNPPYKKIGKNSIESEILKDIVFGQPNLYMLFMAQSAKLLSKKGQMVFIVPRSFFNGKYFSEFRILIYDNFQIEYIHSFESRSKIMNDEILQELVIIKISTRKVKAIKITHSQNDKDLSKRTSLYVEKCDLWDDSKRRNIRLPTTKKDLDLIQRFKNFDITLGQLGLKFRTGPVVDFRVEKGLSHVKTKKTVPLIWCANFENIFLNWPIKNKKYEQYIESSGNNNILLPRANYIVVKRFSSKEEGKILKINIVLKEQLKYSLIGFENHINYLKFERNTERFMKGIFILLNSTLYNDYLRIINGTTQINSSDLNLLPCPSLEKISNLSLREISYEELSSSKCDEILKEII